MPSTAGSSDALVVIAEFVSKPDRADALRDILAKPFTQAMLKTLSTF